MRDIGDQVPAKALDTLHLSGHPVERFRQPPHLVSRGDANALPVVPAGHAGCGSGHVPQRLGHAPGQDPGQEQRDEGGDGSGQQQLPPDRSDESGGRRDRPERAGALDGVAAIHRRNHSALSGHRDPDVLPPCLGSGVERSILPQQPIHGEGDGEVAGQRLPGGIHQHQVQLVPLHRLEQRRRGTPGLVEAELGHRAGLQEQLSELAVAFVPAQGEPDRHVHDEDGDGDGEHDDRSELGPDGRKPVERAHRHQLTPERLTGSRRPP